MLPRELEKRVRHILGGLESGKLQFNHAVNLLLDGIEQRTVESVMGMVPTPVYDALKSMTDGMPRTEDGWAKWQDVFIRCGAVYDPKVSAESLEQQFLNSERRTRRAVEALREYFATHES